MSGIDPTPYSQLTPDMVLQCIEAAGWRCNGHQLALNSYENRVYQIGLEDDGFVIAKFYRPGRWSDAQILEEHEFLFALADHDLPVVAPLRDAQGRSLLQQQGFRLTLFPRQGGHAPNIESAQNLRILGRTLGRIHRVGLAGKFRHRPTLSAQRLGWESRDFLLGNGFIPTELEAAYSSITQDLLRQIDQAPIPAPGRIHGDCHLGNMLWRDGTPHFVDFDDCVQGPAVQDLWMLLSGEREERLAQLDEILGGYEEFASFDHHQLALIEALRSLRLMHHAAWIARRWQDPAFPHAFSWFGSIRYWSDHMLDLREQLAALAEPSLSQG